MTEHQTPSNTATTSTPVPREPVLYVTVDKVNGEKYLVYAKNNVGALAVMASQYEAHRATAEEVMRMTIDGIRPLNTIDDAR